MKYYIEPEKQIPVREEVEVLVVGGGPAGFAAAILAARGGARTMLVEQAGDVGGVATTGLMSHWTGQTQGGFYEELLDRSQDCAEDITFDYHSSLRRIINPEKLKTTLLDMLQEAGVLLLLYTLACDVIMDGDRITGIIVENKSGRAAILAQNRQSMPQVTAISPPRPAFHLSRARSLTARCSR